jgi:hypothetical protein
MLASPLSRIARRHVQSNRTDKPEAISLLFYFLKVIVKNLPPERIDLLQPIRINQNAFRAVQIFLQGIEQLKGRTAVKIAPQTNVQIIIRSMNDDSKIICHSCLSFGCVRISPQFSSVHLV